MSNRKKITLVVLVLLTIILAGISIFVTLRLQESQAPTPTDAATGAGFTNCCGTGIGCSAGGSTCGGGCSGLSCSGPAVKMFKCNGRTNQCGNVSGGGTQPEQEFPWGTSYSVPTGECGKTFQIDVFPQQNYNNPVRDYIVYYTGDCGGTEQPPARKAICGEACNTDSDCTPPTGAGSVVCRDEGGGVKKCANANCPVGKTIPGTICNCDALNACGNPCGSDVGLCQAGSTCRYVNGPNCMDNSASSRSTYCVPDTSETNGELIRRNCVARDQGNSYVTLPSGANPTPAQLINLCNPAPARITCYRCTAVTNDGNQCESQQFDGTSCPTGWTNNANCSAAEAGGACPVIVSCGQTCTNNSQCPSNHSCNSGVCTKNECVSPNVCDSPCGNPIVCGQACQTGSNLCPTGLTCNQGICKLNACLTPGACSDNQCTLAACGDAICNTGELCERTTANGTTYRTCTANGSAPTGPIVASCTFTGANACQQVNQVACGESCQTNANCPTGHTCNNGTCTLNACLTPGNCSGACTPVLPVCGGNCTNNAQCPNNHSCTNNKCVLNGCTPSTCPDGCNVVPIPNTSIGGDDTRLLLIGLILIVGGYLTFKVKFRFNEVERALAGGNKFEDEIEKQLRRRTEDK